jgi:rhamnulose-1-phosphate aldolase/alcohol dehydrogenase
MLYLENLWEASVAARFENDALELLRYRSNLLGADLRITNYGGGNTSAKVTLPDPATGRIVDVLAVKGSGGDLGSITKPGFALLSLDRLKDLRAIYRGEAHEDEMAAQYPHAAFGDSPVAASIDTPLHAFLPFRHVDHLHPDWAIAMAASANGEQRLREFNRQFGHRMVWIPWKRPGFELAMRMGRAVEEHPDCDGMLLANHGLFTWGEAPEECYHASLKMIDDLGQFLDEHRRSRSRPVFGGAHWTQRNDAAAAVVEVFPYLRDAVGQARRVVGHWTASPDVTEFVNSAAAPRMARMGTSCPDHFLRTKVAPLYVEWDPDGEGGAELKKRVDAGLEEYRRAYRAYYEDNADANSPAMRDPNPAVVLIPGLGMFTFGKTKAEARITGEFYTNAIHVMEGAEELGGEDNYVALPRGEAFRIEYWALEEAKLRRMPAELELSRHVVLVAGGGRPAGRALVVALARAGANVMVADVDEAAAARTAEDARGAAHREALAHCAMDGDNDPAVGRAKERTVLRFGGVDAVIRS